MRRDQKRHSARSLLILNFQEDSRGRAGKLSGAPLVDKRSMQWGIRKDLWPKYFPKCPVARHFVCLRGSMSFAIR